MSESSDDHVTMSDDSKVLVEISPAVESSKDTTEESSPLRYIDSQKRDEDEEAYRLQVYGTTSYLGDPQTKRSSVIFQHGSNLRKLSRRFSTEIRRRRSSMLEQLPDTPAGWTVLLSCFLTAGLGYEIQLQNSLTQPPITFGQLPEGSDIMSIFEKMTRTPESILSRPIQPSLFVGTRGVLSSTAAYLLDGPPSKEEHLRFRDVVHSTIDGAALGIDWEVPWKSDSTRVSQMTEIERKTEIVQGPILEPVVIILHGINNDSSFGYMKSLQRSFANRGWNAAALNFRGCGGVPMTTPRGYNGANTNDLRSIVWTISGRMASHVPVFLVGNSLGANIMTKFLGEEGMSGTLPACVSGAASLGNPLSINSSLVRFPFNVAMALGVRKTFLQNWSVFSKMTDKLSRQVVYKALLSPTIAGVDRASAPTLARNDPFYPFAFRIGYKDGNSYWLDSSSYRLVRHISVPFLNLTAEDDFLVAAPNRNRLGFCVSNPNIMVVETRCGGHLGWQESPPESSHFGSSAWSDIATSDFFDAIMKTNMERHGSPVTPHVRDLTSNDTAVSARTLKARKNLQDEARRFRATELKSRM